jgi:predicted nucleotidyltransferase
MVEPLQNYHDAIAAACVRHSVVRLEAFGSVLRDDFVPGQSDVDLLVEFQPDKRINLTQFTSSSRAKR